MTSLHQIPLHVLLLAGLLSPLSAQVPATPPAAAPRPTVATAFAGLYVNPLTDDVRGKAGVTIPDGVGVTVVLVDAKGPATGKLEVGDILTRLDDQVLVTPDQFRALIKMRKAGDKVKLVAIREGEIKLVELELTERQGPAPRISSTPRSLAQNPSQNSPQPSAGAAVVPDVSITVNGQKVDLGNMPGGAGTVTQVGPGHVVIIGPNQKLPPEVLKQLEEMRARGLPIPPLDSLGLGAAGQSDKITPNGTTNGPRIQSKSFSLNLGAESSSSSVASDAQGTVGLEQKNGKKHVVVKDPEGKVLFEGEVTTDEQRAKMPAALRERLKLVDGPMLTIPGLNQVPTPAPVEPEKKRNPKEGA